MKPIIWIYILFLAVIYSCSTDEIDRYEGEARYLFFSEGIIADSISTSFFFYPTEDIIEIPLELCFAGGKITKDLRFKLEADPRYTTAKQGIDFTLENDYIWKANREKDTIYVKLHKTENLSSQMLRLVLNIAENENFRPGPAGQAKSRMIVFTSQAIRPAWWNQQIIDYYLGEYSDDKYALFIEKAGISDMSEMNATQKRYYSLKLKYYLIEMKDKNTPVMDGDIEMTVPVIG